MTEPIPARELDYSPSYGGWFWGVRVENPRPIRLPNGSPSRMDEWLTDRGFTKTRRGAEWEMRRAERRFARRIAKAGRIATS